MSLFPNALDNLAAGKTAGVVVDASDHPNHHNALADAVNTMQAWLINQWRAGGLPTGGGRLPLRTALGAYVMQPTDGVVKADATGGAFAVTLPDAMAALAVQRVFVVVKIDASANAVTVNTQNGQTINASSSASLASRWSVGRYFSDGSNWIAL